MKSLFVPLQPNDDNNRKSENKNGYNEVWADISITFTKMKPTLEIKILNAL